LPREAQRYEPRGALDGGIDGLDLHRRVADELWRWLSPTGVLIAECAAHQVSAVLTLFMTHGWESATIGDDDIDAHVVVVNHPARGRL
jgi:release factor glutamine methyltransferase